MIVFGTNFQHSQKVQVRSIRNCKSNPVAIFGCIFDDTEIQNRVPELRFL